MPVLLLARSRSPRIIRNGYDAELDIGLVSQGTAGGTTVPNSTIATANRVKLNAALAAMHENGAFTFADGRVGPVLYPIYFAAKEFFFNGVIYTNRKIGGAMYGCGGRPYPGSEAAYYNPSSTGGAVTRLTRLDAPSGDSCQILLRGAGFRLGGFDLRAARYTYDGDLTVFNRPLACIAIESNGVDISSGKHHIFDCGLNFAKYGIYCPPGYYSTPETALTSNLNVVQAHADESDVDGIYAAFLESYWRVENEQSVNWSHKNIRCISPGIAYPMTIFDMYRAGKFSADNITINMQTCTLLRTHELSGYSNKYSITNFWWDHFASSQSNYLTLWKHTHPGASAATLPIDINITGHLAFDSTEFDVSKLIQFPEATFGTTTPLVRWNDIKFDITNLPRVINGNVAFPLLGNGPTCHPSKAYWSPQQEVAGYSWTISSGTIQASEDSHAVDTEGAASTDDLVTINGGRANQRLTIFPASSARSIVVKAGVADITNLTSFWKLDETVSSAARLDSHGSNNFILGSVNAAATGVLGSAAVFPDTPSTYMYVPSNSGLQIGDVDFTISAWVKLTTKPAHFSIIAGKYAGGGIYEWQLYWDNAADRFKFRVSPDGTAGAFATITAGSAPSLATWYNLVAGHDASNNVIFMSVNGTAVTPVAHTTGVYVGTGNFMLSDAVDSSQNLSGQLDEVGFWKGRRLSAQNITDLYNAGAAQAYPFYPLVGNIRAAGDFTMDNADDRMVLEYNGTVWTELSRSNNGA